MLLALYHPDIETDLGDAGLGEPLDLRAHLGGGADQGEPVRHVVGHRACVGRLGMAVLEIVVAAHRVHPFDEIGGEIGGRVMAQQVLHVVGDGGGKAAHPRERVLAIRGDVRRRGRDNRVGRGNEFGVGEHAIGTFDVGLQRNGAC